MFGRSVVTFLAASLVALATTGCPSPSVVQVNDPFAGKDVAAKDETTVVRNKLAQTRARHLDQLHAYWQQGEFPQNELSPRIANVFRDDIGRLCAVANMIQKDGGNDALIDQTARDNNMIRLADVESGPLYDWILTSGFTQEEIAMIQVPYMPPRQMSEEQERARIQERLSNVEDRLRDDTEQSIEVAAQRYLQHRSSVRYAAN